VSSDAEGSPAAEGADAEGGIDHKSALNQYCHKYCSRPVTKDDVVYTKTKFGTRQFQAIVKLNCMGGQEYAGDVCETSKEAEKAAAFQALEAYKSVPLPSPPPPGGRKNRVPTLQTRSVDPATGELVENDEFGDEDNPALTNKVKLNALYMRIVKRALLKGETVYECQPLLDIDGQVAGFVATVRLSSLPGEWSGRAFQGDFCQNKQEATQSAAKVALAEISADPELGKLANQDPRTNAKGRGKSKGWHWTRGWQDEFRERVGEGTMCGEIVEWRGNFGWIMPSQEPDHPAASKRGGKVYVHKRDLSAEAPEDLPVGAKVQFLVYCDPSGLGAEQVVLT